MAERLRRLSDADLERALTDLGQHLDLPPAPPLAGAVRRRLLAAPRQPWRPIWFSLRRLALALLTSFGGAYVALRPEIAERRRRLRGDPPDGSREPGDGGDDPSA